MRTKTKLYFILCFPVVNGFVFVGRYLKNGFSFSRFSTPQAVLFTLLYKLRMQISFRTNKQSARGALSLLETRHAGKMLLTTANWCPNPVRVLKARAFMLPEAFSRARRTKIFFFASGRSARAAKPQKVAHNTAAQEKTSGTHVHAGQREYVV